MRRLRFFISKSFFLTLLKAAVIGFGLIFLLFLFLHLHTRHNRVSVVPDLHQIPIAEAEDLLSDLRLNFEVIDSTQFNPDIVPLSVIEHQPRAHD